MRINVNKHTHTHTYTQILIVSSSGTPQQPTVETQTTQPQRPGVVSSMVACQMPKIHNVLKRLGTPTADKWATGFLLSLIKAAFREDNMCLFL